jgi:hypothetical protein
MEIHPVGAELFHVDGWTDMMKLIVTFQNFANTPKNGRLGLNKPLGNVEDFE